MLSDITTYSIYLEAAELGESGRYLFGGQEHKAYLYKDKIYFKIELTPYAVSIKYVSIIEEGEEDEEENAL